MPSLHFFVQGSDPEPYEVKIVQRENMNVSAYCSCAAGEKGLHCKHRVRILRGQIDDIVSDNQDDVKTVVSWISGSDIETAIYDLMRAEEELESLKKRITSFKKSLARAMLN